ncbi:HAD hydrolase-like protein [Rummeliibacillus sp. NPDC094406]|uniref:HAD hydrolase-like protein n=1 Tax=Rummeliibacillus sp. NPDC094406 TaxID=3364511 RepID=UPI00380EC520
MKQALIFDMDGTLFQTNLILEPALIATFDVLRKNNLWDEDTPIDTYREIIGVPLPVVWKTLCPSHTLLIREKSNEIFQEKLIELIKAKKGSLYPNAEFVLERLSIDNSLYIASNGQEAYLQAIVDTYDLNRFIKKVYSIQSISSGQKSDLVKKVMNENYITGGAVIGDRLSDIMAAKDNKLTAIGVNFDFAQAEELKQADKVIDHLIELL